MCRARRALCDRIAYYEFEQLMFDRQWRALRRHAAERGVGLIGDVPIFLAHESADVWAHQELFRLDGRGLPTHVSGVPPDAFSASGQRWGTPLYRWGRLARDGFAFWCQRLARELEHFDCVRLDHFIGFARYWEIPSEAPDAVTGRWIRGPGEAFFNAIRRDLGARGLLQGGRLPLIAEDLGCVNRAVRALRDRFGLPGMRVLQFAFGDGAGGNEHLPHNHPRRCVAYTGTHDNDTTRGWFADDGETGPRTAVQCARERASAVAYLMGPHVESSAESIHLAMIRTLFAGAAHTAMVPMQDWLGLGSEDRMNVPGRAEGNWEYHLEPGALSGDLAGLMATFVSTYGRVEPLVSSGRLAESRQRILKVS